MRTKYQCEICHQLYDTPDDAFACEASGTPPICAVGDIVICGPCYGWYDGDPEWVFQDNRPFAKANQHSNCFGACCNLSFFYIVTAIDRVDGHRNRYHIATLALQNGRDGWTTDDGGHHTPERVSITDDKRLHLLTTSAYLMGRKFRNLL